MADPWVAPDTPAPSAPHPPPASPVVAGTVPPGPSADLTAPAVRLPVPLRPLTLSDILDGGLRAFKLAPGTMAGLAALFVVPTQALLGWLTRDAADDVAVGQSFADAFSATGTDDIETGIGGDVFFVALVVQGIALAFVTAAVARLVTGWYTGRPFRFGELAGGAVRRGWALVAAWVLVHLVEAVFAIALVVPLVVPMTWYAVVTPVIACEGAGPLRAMGRSYRLCRSRFGAVLGACLLAALVHEVLSGALSGLGAIYLELDLPAGWVVASALSAGALLVTTPFLAGVSTLLYLDLRVRAEGLDIELAAARRFP